MHAIPSSAFRSFVICRGALYRQSWTSLEVPSESGPPLDFPLPGAPPSHPGVGRRAITSAKAHNDNPNRTTSTTPLHRQLQRLSVALVGAMPTLPLPYRRSAAAPASDTRILDSRQLPDFPVQDAEAISNPAGSIEKRLPNVILPRQAGGAVLAIPTQYQGLNSGPSPGAVVGIVLGSVAGFLLLLWILWLLSSGTGFIRSSTLQEEDVVIRRRSRSRGTRRSRRTEMSSRSPRRERVIRQERIIRDIPPPREPSRIRETVVVDESRPARERRVEGDDIVEVIEEHSSIGVPEPRRKNRRSSGYR